ncbi:hypothetical protein B0H63DRAFT_95800 [Podospora didyma]|uniref:Secreted protein n=1 Tax=Podospora didyma TaxID=330526 RepID=A0AAE0NWV8_9PEZI|nr:hypothetical protein B0H63DRAFT_95800 [Podospora didyma]
MSSALLPGTTGPCLLVASLLCLPLSRLAGFPHTRECSSTEFQVVGLPSQSGTLEISHRTPDFAIIWASDHGSTNLSSPCHKLSAYVPASIALEVDLLHEDSLLAVAAGCHCD